MGASPPDLFFTFLDEGSGFLTAEVGAIREGVFDIAAARALATRTAEGDGVAAGVLLARGVVAGF